MFKITTLAAPIEVEKGTDPVEEDNSGIGVKDDHDLDEGLNENSQGSVVRVGGITFTYTEQTFNNTVVGSDAENRRDIFIFSLSAVRTVTLVLKNQDDNAHLALWKDVDEANDFDLTGATKIEDSENGGNLSEEIEVVDLPEGKYYAIVYTANTTSSTNNRYTFSCTVKEPEIEEEEEEEIDDDPNMTDYNFRATSVSVDGVELAWDRLDTNGRLVKKTRINGDDDPYWYDCGGSPFVGAGAKPSDTKGWIESNPNYIIYETGWISLSYRCIGVSYRHLKQSACPSLFPDRSNVCTTLSQRSVGMVLKLSWRGRNCLRRPLECVGLYVQAG